MPTPTFDELLSQAKNLSQRRAEAQNFDTVGNALTSSFQFLENIFTGRGGQTRETFTGQIDPETGTFESFKKPRFTGRNLIDRLMGRQGLDREDLSGIPVTQKQAAEFGLKKTLLRTKEKIRADALKGTLAIRKNIAEIKAKAGLTPKQRGDLLDKQIKTATRLKEVAIFENDAGTVIEMNNAIREAQEALNAITIPPDQRGAPNAQGTIRVRLKRDFGGFRKGKTGKIPTHEFDDNLHELLQ